MKNIGLSIAFASFLMIASCGKKEETETTETNTVEKETVIVTDTIQVEKPETEGTSVKVNSEGVDFDSKDVKVEIKK